MTVRAKSKRPGGKKKKTSRAASPKGKTTDRGGRKPNRKRAPKKKAPAATVLAAQSSEAELRKDATLVARAVKERWPSDERLRSALRKRLEVRALQTEDDKTLGQLARVAVMMEGQNQKDEIAKEMAQARVIGTEVLAPLAGANIESAQIVLMVPDNGRGPNRK